MSKDCPEERKVRESRHSVPKREPEDQNPSYDISSNAGGWGVPSATSWGGGSSHAS